MTRKETEAFVRQRSRAMAVVHLTRRDDLHLDEPGPGEPGLTFLVRLAKSTGRPSLRQFGVVLDGAMAGTTSAKLNKSLNPRMRALESQGDYPYPVCLFYFTMADNQGYYAWVAEPAVTEEGQPRLHARVEADCQPLDRSALDAIVGRVDGWYGALYASIRAATPA